MSTEPNLRMKKLSLFLFIPAFFLCAFRPEAEKPRVVIPPHVNQGEAAVQKEFSIATWNIEWFPGGKPNESSPEKVNAHIRGVAEWIQKHAPTILIACEVRDLASLQKMNLEEYPSLACTEFEESHPGLPNLGIAFVSRVPWKEIWALDFSNLAQTRDRPPRGILGAEFILPSGERLTVYGVHLKSNYGNNETTRLQRQRAIRYLEWDWRRRGINPARENIILAGDFNVSLHDPAFDEEQTFSKLLGEHHFTSALHGLSAKEQFTLPGRKIYSGNTFDYILFSPSLRKKLKRKPPWGRVIPVPPTLSDHFPVLFCFPE